MNAEAQGVLKVQILSSIRALIWMMSLSGLIAFLCFQLGLWQLKRANEKNKALTEVALLLENLDAASTPNFSLADLQQMPLTTNWLTDQLEFLPTTVLLDNQQRAGRSGIKVYQAARSAHATQISFVDLGWLPLPGDRQLPIITPLSGTLKISGLWTRPPAAGIALGPALSQAAQPGVWLATRMEPEALSSVLNLPADHVSSQIIRLDPQLPFGYDRDLNPLPNTLPPERHLGYAVTWFGLGLTMIAAAFCYWIKKFKPVSQRHSITKS